MQPDNSSLSANIRDGVYLNDADGNLVGAAEFFTDISNEEAMHIRIKELESLALLDTLTQLPNRNHLVPELESRLREKARLSLSFGLLFMDIDHFKRFNDACGHDIGDEVLGTVATAGRPFDLAGRWEARSSSASCAVWTKGSN